MIADFELIERSNKDGSVTQRLKYRTANRKDALDSLARCHGIFRDRVEHEHTHKVRAVFEFVGQNVEHGEPIARLNRRSGQRNGPRLIDAKVENRDCGDDERLTNDQSVTRGS